MDQPMRGKTAERPPYSLAQEEERSWLKPIEFENGFASGTALEFAERLIRPAADSFDEIKRC
jgi:hypothetical protein